MIEVKKAISVGFANRIVNIDNRGPENPILACDFGDFDSKSDLPFSTHPHAGLTVMTVPLQGCTMVPWDNGKG